MGEDRFVINIQSQKNEFQYSLELYDTTICFFGARAP